MFVLNRHKRHESRLRNLHSLTDHSTAVHQKDKDDRVEFGAQERSGTEGYFRTDPALADPEGHHEYNAERGGRGKTLKVFCLARSIVRNAASGYVEASETEKTAEGEAGEKELIERSAEAEGERCSRRGDAEGDLEKYKLVI